MKLKQSTGIKKKTYFDFTLFLTLFFLIAFGLVMIYSTSYYTASLTFDGDGLYYLKRQMISTGAGLVVMTVAFFFPCEKYKKAAIILYLLSIISVLLILTPLGHTANGARRWLRIKGFSIQPAEIVKVGVIIITAYLIDSWRNLSDKAKNSFKYIIVVLLPAFVAAMMILVITSNLSSAIIIGGIAYVMLLVSNPKCRKAYLLLFLLLLAGGAVVLYLYIKVSSGSEITSLSYRFERILAWFDPERYADGTGFQTLQALYGIGSGGFFGKGLGKSMQKLGFLPEANNDMIFSVICEELGLFGGLAVIIMFAILLYRLFDISKATKNYFCNLVVIGVFAHIAIQVVLNIAVVTNTIPNTGISLPFISYGGTSVIFLLFEMGMVMNVAKKADFTDTRKHPARNLNAQSGDNE